MNANVKTVIFWVVLICVAVLLWAVVRQGHNKTDHALSFSEFLDKVESGNVRDVVINGNEVKGDFVNSDAFHTIAPSNYPKLYDLLQDKKVQMTFRIRIPADGSRCWCSLRRSSC